MNYWDLYGFEFLEHAPKVSLLADGVCCIDRDELEVVAKRLFELFERTPQPVIIAFNQSTGQTVAFNRP